MFPQIALKDNKNLMCVTDHFFLPDLLCGQQRCGFRKNIKCNGIANEENTKLMT